MAKMPMWVTGAKTRQHRRGFTLVELMAALAIAAVVLAVAVPASVRMYDTIRYREAVREVISMLATARYRAIASGLPQNVEVVPSERRLRFDDKTTVLPANVKMAVHSAKELNRGNTGVIRFYPEGGSSGGGVDIESDRGRGVSIRVDWLMGGVTQQTYAAR